MFDYPEDYSIAHTYSSEQRTQRTAAIQEEVSADLMCRAADYIIYDPTRLIGSFNRMSQNGLFIDLLPYSFNYDCVFLNRSVLEELGIDPAEIQTVTTTQLLDWYEQARALEPDLQLYFGATGKEQLFPMEQATCYDLGGLTARFDSPEFVDFLACSRDVINEEPGLDPIALEWVGNCNGAIADEILRWQDTQTPPTTFSYSNDEDFGLTRLVKNARRSFATVEQMEIYSLANLQYPLEYMAGPYPLLNSEGGLRLTTRDAFAVPACHPNPELAWEFIRYCLAERDNMSFAVSDWSAGRPYTSYIPAHQANFRKMAAWLPEYVKAVDVVGYPIFDPIDVDALQAGLDFGLGQELFSRLSYNLSMDDYLDEFYLQELTTPEECAKKLQGRAEIWLNE